MRFYNLTRGSIVIEKVRIAEKYFERSKGLLGKNKIEENEGLFIKKCNWIHTFLMRFPIDAVFLRKERGTDAKFYAKPTQNKTIYKVVKIFNNIKPWRICPPVFEADSALEIKAGVAVKNMININDELKIVEDF